MNEIHGNLWNFYDTVQNIIICITTNGFIKKDGSAVMGRGCALECKKRFPDIEKKLGLFIKQNGNIVQYIKYNIIAFPVKHNWWEDADINLIKKSFNQLNEIIIRDNLKKVYLPRPGCGNGKLNWDYVKKEIEPLVHQNIIIVSFKEGN